ncbi:MAG: HEAT repeat domain-containing protein [Gemmataceae bacterium]
MKASRHEDMKVRDTALLLLARVKDKPKSCIPVLLECLNDKESKVRERAIDRLNEMWPEAGEVMSALRAAITDSEFGVRFSALRMAGRYGAQAKPLVPALLKRLEKPDALVRLSFTDEFVVIMDTLATIGPIAKEALPRLRKLREKPPEGSPPTRIAGSPDKTYREIIDDTIKKIEGK